MPTFSSNPAFRAICGPWNVITMHSNAIKCISIATCPLEMLLGNIRHYYLDIWRSHESQWERKVGGGNEGLHRAWVALTKASSVRKTAGLPEDGPFTSACTGLFLSPFISSLLRMSQTRLQYFRLRETKFISWCPGVSLNVCFYRQYITDGHLTSTKVLQRLIQEISRTLGW